MHFSKLALAAAASVGSLASAQLIPFDITGSGGDFFDYPFNATGVPNTITVDAFFVNGGAGTQAGDLQIILTSPSGTCLELGGRDLGFGCPDGGDFPGSWNSTAPDQYLHTFDINGSFGLEDGQYVLTVRHGFSGGGNDTWIGSASITFGDTVDCNANGIDDAEDIANGTSEDCNINGLPDECEADPANDCNGNGVLDACEELPDCDDDGITDCDELAQGAADCDSNQIPDVCEPGAGVPNDLLEDAIEIFTGTTIGNTECAGQEDTWLCEGNFFTGDGPDIWYVFTISESSTVSMTTCDSDYDTDLSIHSPSGTILFCDGDSGDDDASQGCVIYASELNVSLEAGTYYVRVGGYNGAVGNVSLDVLITNGTDCNGNGVSDEEDIANGTSEDCNNSTIPDECEADPITDCDGNGVLDSCEDLPDCDGDGISNCGEIAGGAADCDANGIPDSCESGGGESNQVGVPFDSGVLDGTQASAPFTVQANGSLTSMAIDLTYTNVDADGSWAGDLLIQITDPQGTCVEVGGFNVDLCTEVDDFPAEWDVAASGDYSYTVDFCGTALTGDGTWTFVFVHGWDTGTQDQWAGSLTLEVVGEGGFSDCNGNGIEDIEDIANGTSEDCNDNGRPDECDLGPSTDCDGNGVIDACETLPDCDSNGISDCAEIAGGATDCNADGIPDSCESAGGGENIELSFDTGVLDGNGISSVYEVEFDGVFASLGVDLAFTNLDDDATWAGDLIIQITDPDGTCVEVGGFNVDLCEEIGDFPAEWDVAASGDYTHTYDFCGQGLVGGGTWSIAFAHGYDLGLQDQWAGTLTLNVLGDNPPEPCPADFDGDGTVGFTDLTVLLSSYGLNDGGDLDGNGETGFTDLTILLSAYGSCP